MTLIARASTVLLLLGGFVAATPAPSFGVAFLVTRTDDPAPDGCAPADCSLREAIVDANSLTGPDTVSVPPGTYTLAIPPDGTPDDAQDGDLDILEALTITGAGAQTTTIDGGDVDRIFHQFSTSLNISNLTIRNGKTADVNGGGGIIATAALTLERVAVTGKEATAGSGGGIVVTSSSASVTILSSALTSNVTSDPNGEGGALFVNDASATLTNVTVSGNMANGSGGGISHQNGTTELVNVTVAGNTADADDAGPTGGGGGIAQTGGTVSLFKTIVAGNIDASSVVKDPDCFGSITSQGSNLIQSLSANCTFTPLGGDITGQDPKLGSLADNGGPTMTHALLPGSPAATTTGLGGAAFDQRGAPRGHLPHIGAYELVLCGGGVVNRVGTEGSDVITGTQGPDVVLALGGNDSIDAREGDDKVCAGVGTDTLSGGAGNDTLEGDSGDDVLTGAGGNDGFVGGEGSDRLLESGDVDFTLTDTSLASLGTIAPTTDTLTSVELATLSGGASANDIDVSGFSGDVTAAAGEGDDGLVAGSAGNHVLDGGPGQDVLIYFGDGNFTLTNASIGGVGKHALSSIEDAFLFGGPERNVIDASGFTGSTFVLAGGGRDRVVGGPRSDLLAGEGGNDHLVGGKGADQLIGNRGHDRLFGGAGKDGLNGGRDRDRLFGGAEKDRLNGGKGPDLCRGTIGADTFRSCEIIAAA